MTADQIGILVLVLLFVAGYAFRKWFISQPKTYKISEQYISNRKLIIYDHNPRSEHSTIEIACQINEHNNLNALSFGIELIQKKRDLLKIEFNSYPELEFEQRFSDNQSFVRFFIEKRSLLEIIRNEEFKLYRFRFFVKTDELNYIKSPEFTFSSKFLIIKPDTGKFN